MNCPTITSSSNADKRSQQEVIADAIRQVFDLVRKHPKEDQDLFKRLFVHLFKVESPEEALDTINTMVEVLCDSNKPSTATKIVAVELPPVEEESPPKAAKLRAWTEYITKTIQRIRNDKGMTQEQLAEASGLRQSHISRIETAMHCPSHKTLVRIAKALGVSVESIDPV